MQGRAVPSVREPSMQLSCKPTLATVCCWPFPAEFHYAPNSDRGRRYPNSSSDSWQMKSAASVRL